MEKVIKSPYLLEKSYKLWEKRWSIIFWSIIAILFINLVVGYFVLKGNIPSSIKGAVVKISTDGGVGTGFFVAPDFVLTAAHVAGAVNNSVTIETESGESYQGQVVASDYTKWHTYLNNDGTVKDGATPYDWSLIRVTGAQDNENYILWESVSSVQQAQSVYLFGHPHGQPLTVTKGIISRIDSNEIHTDGAIDAGFSGGPMIWVGESGSLEDGSVIGVVVSSPVGMSTVNTAVPIDLIIQKCNQRGFSIQ